MEINNIFDTLFKDGIPKDRITMMVGESCTGKSLWMANQHMIMSMNQVKLKNELIIKKLNSL
jgi:ABC-type dipeptide/oligopeptide/nickel transport system ATPase component